LEVCTTTPLEKFGSFGTAFVPFPVIVLPQSDAWLLP
jgi:hypothetical protein